MASTTTSSTWDKSKPYFPVAGLANDGWSTDDEATASCFCGAVQLSFVSFRTEFVAAFLPSYIPPSQLMALVSSAHLSATVPTVTNSPHQSTQATLRSSTRTWSTYAARKTWRHSLNRRQFSSKNLEKRTPWPITSVQLAVRSCIVSVRLSREWVSCA